jgi:hypothetical protein
VAHQTRGSGAWFDVLEIASSGYGFSGRNRSALLRRYAVTLEFLVCHVATEVCQDSARMNCEGADSIRFAAPIEFHRKQNIRGFRLAVGLPPVIGAMLKIRIVEINFGPLMTA